MIEKDKFTEVLWMSRFHYDEQSILIDHKHGFYQVIYCIEGSGFIHLGDQKYKLECPVALFIKPDEIHGIQISDTLKTIDIKFVVNSSEFAAELSKLPSIIHHPNRNDTLYLIESMIGIGGEERLFYRERCRFILNLVLMEWLEAEEISNQEENAERVYTSSPVAKTEICIKLMEFIDSNLSQSLNGSRLAKELDYSYRYISSCCMKEFSLTPMQLIRNRRIQRAKELLMRDNCEIKEITFDLGFKSVYHFTRIFTECVGKPPGKWKNDQLQKICHSINIDPNFFNKLKIVKAK